jgi:hypothetical protein
MLFNSVHFGDIQKCLFPRGTVSIALQFRAAFELYNQHDKPFFDGDNGFNNCNRGQGLFQVMQHFPTLYPLVDMLYGKNGNAFTHFNNVGIKTLESCEGVQQGDAMSM